MPTGIFTQRAERFIPAVSADRRRAVHVKPLGESGRGENAKSHGPAAVAAFFDNADLRQRRERGAINIRAGRFGVVAAYEQPFAADIHEPVAGHVDHRGGVIVNHAAVVEKPKIRAAARDRSGRNAIEHHAIGPSDRWPTAAVRRPRTQPPIYDPLLAFLCPTESTRRNLAHIP